MINILRPIGLIAVDSKKLLLDMSFVLSQSAYTRSVEFNTLMNQFESESNVLNVDAALWSKAGAFFKAATAERNTTQTQRYNAACVSKLFTAIVNRQLRDEG